MLTRSDDLQIYTKFISYLHNHLRTLCRSARYKTRRKKKFRGFIHRFFFEKRAKDIFYLFHHAEIVKWISKWIINQQPLLTIPL
ncbi:hypothetical protein PUN28_007439 [Cardiocondyla obscurior]|uniref:Uncharacterized protein n=1 Tax=Cardiocondyla obscurior TaxID=286306 RepID=A0AAW2G880_9HYME